MEALILYFVLFFPGIFETPFPGGNAEVINFSVFRELGRILTYTIPSLALLWYLILDKKSFSALKAVKVQKGDIIPFAAGLPGLIIIGLAISLLVPLFSNHTALIPPPFVEGPVSIPGWIVLVLSCLGTGYLEESYFRYYLLTRMEKPVPQTALKIIFSTTLFSLCHVYEGPWGVLNAVMAGILLSAIFLRFRSLHGIAWAHGAYNIFVYFIGKFTV